LVVNKKRPFLELYGREKGLEIKGKRRPTIQNFLAAKGTPKKREEKRSREGENTRRRIAVSAERKS